MEVRAKFNQIKKHFRRKKRITHEDFKWLLTEFENSLNVIELLVAEQERRNEEDLQDLIESYQNPKKTVSNL